VLFDEIEKAHRDVLTTLMNAMDAGRLSSAAQRTRGRVIDCRYAMFFFTSNLDSDGILAELEERRPLTMLNKSTPFVKAGSDQQEFALS